jgi:hypothetical protein
METVKSLIADIWKWIVILILVTMLFSKCKNEQTLKGSLQVANSETTHFKNKLGTITAEREVLKLDKKQLQEQVINKDQALKKLASEFSEVKAIVKTKVEVKFDTIKKVFEVKVPCDFERFGTIEKEWYSLDYKINQNGLEIPQFKTWSDITAITGFKKKWFWGKKTYTTNVTASNPNITIPEIQVYEKHLPVKWYETTLFKVGIGFAAGAVLIN